MSPALEAQSLNHWTTREVPKTSRFLWRRQWRPRLVADGGSDSRVSAYNAGDPGSIPGSGRSPGEGNDNPLQHSRLENPVYRGAWWAAIHGVTRRWT